MVGKSRCSWAALMGPIPGAGEQGRGRAVTSWCRSASSWWASCRAARARWVVRASAARWPGAPPDRWAGRPARRRHQAVGARAAPAGGLVAARGGDDQALELAAGVPPAATVAVRVVCRTRRASRCPRWCGLVRWSQARASRPARMASNSSLLAGWRPRAAWVGRSPTTPSPWSTRTRVSPAHRSRSLQAQTRRSAAWASASRSSRACPDRSFGTSRVARPAVGIQQAAAWRSRWGSTPKGGVDLALEHGHRGCSVQTATVRLAAAWVASPRAAGR
jgi:hypothetical protein